MTQRSWFPGGADQKLDPGAVAKMAARLRYMQCDDPPTAAQALEAAPDVAALAEEERNVRRAG